MSSAYTTDRRSPLQFFLVVFVLSIPFWYLGTLNPVELLPGLPLSALNVLIPVLAASILVYRQDTASGVAELLKRSFDYKRTKAKLWYVPTILLMPAISVLAYAVMRFQRLALPAPRFTIGTAFTLFLISFIAGLGEELGWSGYALDPLQTRWNALQASIFLGLVTAVWHVVPLVQAGRSATWIAWWSLAVVAQRVLQVWLYNNTGKSVFAAALFHAMVNVTWQLFPNQGSHYDPRITGLIAASLAAIVVAVWGPRTLTRASLLHSFRLLTSMIVILSTLAGCSPRPRTEDLEAVEYTPLPRDDWQVSTPAEQGLDPMLVAELYYNAGKLPRLYGLLVVKNGYLIAEKYFNEGAADRKNRLKSATKSVTSALVGIALDQGCLSSVDQKMMDFFPEFADHITDLRKGQITIRDMLQMRAGYPFEETDPAMFEALWSGDYLRRIVEFPLTADPGTRFQYSNLTTHWLGVIVARACDTDLRSFGQEHLFSPLGMELGAWIQDRDGYYIGPWEMHFTARDLAKFGLLYLNDGQHEGKQIVSADWVRDSLQRYSEGLTNSLQDRLWGEGRFLRDVGYGYQWWSARAGNHHFNFAKGHGGQLIVLLDQFDMVVVVAADPFYAQHDEESWKHELAHIKLVAQFIKSLPNG